jgi:hypothetical protein
VLHGSRTVPWNWSLSICTMLCNYYSSFPSWNFNKFTLELFKSIWNIYDI